MNGKKPNLGLSLKQTLILWTLSNLVALKKMSCSVAMLKRSIEGMAYHLCLNDTSQEANSLKKFTLIVVRAPELRPVHSHANSWIKFDY
jgi:hypothetical protein